MLTTPLLKSIALIITTVFLVSTSSTVTAGWLSPGDYDECILESMKGVTSNLAAAHIAKSCRKKFLVSGEKHQYTTTKNLT